MFSKSGIIPILLRAGYKTRMSTYMGLALLFLGYLLPLSRGLPLKRSDLWTNTDIPVSPLPLTAVQNVTTLQSGTETGFVLTPLPWPHSTGGDVNPAATASTTSPPQDNLTTTVTPMTLNQSRSWTIASVGCYRDSYVEPRPLPELIADFRDTIDRKDVNKTIMACAEKAREKGFKFFGIQFYTECRSGTGAEKTYGRDGTSKDCENGVGKSGANFVYRFGDYELPPCAPCAKPRRLCFPAISRVTLESGVSITMRQLNIGDRVGTLGTDGETMFSEVIAFLHREIKTVAHFYNLETSRGNVVRLSSQHLIFRKKNTTSPISAVFASEINIGDLLYTSNGNISSFQAVSQITMTTETGVYAPLTRKGTLLVDGALVSCYAHWPSHDTAHLVMAPLRAVNTLYGAWKRLASLINLTQWYTSQQTEGIQWYAGALMPLTYIFLPL